jgi:hypothetical protein
VYDMYPWDSASQGDYPPEPMRSRRAQKTRETSPALAVQIALDRRDNGGDAAAAAPPAPAAAPHAATAAASTHTAAGTPAAAGPPAASAHATPPTASLTRQ